MTEGRDEAFWARQAARREKRLGQPACTQSGMSWTMIDMPGDFAVVIHGEFDCLNCFHHHTGRSAGRYYSTRLSEEALTTGDTETVLARLLHLIAKHDKPEAVVVLGTCPVEVIGAQYTDTVARVAEETGVPMVALRTSGLALSSQRQMLDWLYVTLAKLPAGPPVDRAWQREVALVALQAAFGADGDPAAHDALFARLRALRPPAGQDDRPRVNLVGLPDAAGRVPEAVLLLDRAGIAVNGVYPEGASLAAWRAIHHATTTFAVDRSVYPKLLGRLERGGQAIVELPLPVGVAQTVRFYEAVGAATGRAAEVEALVAPLARRLEARVASFRRKVRGVRLAYTLRMTNNYKADTVAYDGLGEVAAWVELGFDVTLLIQGAGEAAVREAHAEALAAHGLDLPFQTFAGPHDVKARLAEGRYHLAVVEDTVRGLAREVGVAAVETGALRPWLTAVPDNLERAARLVADALRGAA